MKRGDARELAVHLIYGRAFTGEEPEQVVSTRLVTGLGTLPLAAHHLANTAESISYLPGEGIAYAATTLVA